MFPKSRGRFLEILKYFGSNLMGFRSLAREGDGRHGRGFGRLVEGLLVLLLSLKTDHLDRLEEKNKVVEESKIVDVTTR